MENEFQFSASEIPKDLQEALGRALHNICIFIHDHAGKNTVTINVYHTSDAMAKVGGSRVEVTASGIPITRDPRDNPKDIAQEMLKRILSERKDKGEGK
jgi:hypothetical protein